MKKKLVDKALELLQKIDQKYNLVEEDPVIHKEIQDLFETSVDDVEIKKDIEWEDGNGY